jgi:hypothetical protein
MFIPDPPRVMVLEVAAPPDAFVKFWIVIAGELRIVPLNQLPNSRPAT